VNQKVNPRKEFEDDDNTSKKEEKPEEKAKD